MLPLSPNAPDFFSSSLSPGIWGPPFSHKRTKPLVSNAAVLPEQFYDVPERRYRNSGVAALLRAVLDDAMICLQKYSDAVNAESRRLAKEAEDWIFSNEEEWTFSFLNICFVLGLDPSSLRRQLRASLRHPVRAARRKKHIVARHHLRRITRAA